MKNIETNKIKILRDDMLNKINGGLGVSNSASGKDIENPGNGYGLTNAENLNFPLVPL